MDQPYYHLGAADLAPGQSPSPQSQALATVQMFDYGGTKGASSPTNELHEFLIEFESQEACYPPGNPPTWFHSRAQSLPL